MSLETTGYVSFPILLRGVRISAYSMHEVLVYPLIAKGFRRKLGKTKVNRDHATPKSRELQSSAECTYAQNYLNHYFSYIEISSTSPLGTPTAMLFYKPTFPTVGNICTVSSVAMEITGPNGFKVNASKNGAPYTIFGNHGREYFSYGRPLEIGTYMVSAVSNNFSTNKKQVTVTVQNC
jgi:hypothetical protein